MNNAQATIEPRINPSALPSRGTINLDRIEGLSDKLVGLVESIKLNAFLPASGKTPPTFSQVQLAAMCKMSTDSFARRLSKADELGLPVGTVMPSKIQIETNEEAGSSNSPSEDKNKTKPKTPSENKSHGRRQWTLVEARQWVKSFGIPFQRPEGVPGAVVTIANFKGGVGKTVTAMTLAQGLSLMGYKVLAIDVDAQGSLTSLFGVLPTDVEDEMTILPIMVSPTEDIARNTVKESIRTTYWDGLDLIAGSRSLFGGEFYLPSRQLNNEPGFSFYEVLNRALDDGTRMEYDYIIIDTMPSLSYLSMNTLWAADAVVMPLPPEGLDIVSASQFWTMFTELARIINTEKTFKFIGVLPSKVDHTKGHTKSLLKWIQAGFGEFMLPIEIPSTQVVSLSSTELRTVFDITKYVGATKTYARARDAYDKLVAEIDHLTRQTCWTENKETNHDEKK